jgi:lactoylglutathione lyase
VPDVAAACEAVKKGAGQVTRETGSVKYSIIVMAFVEDPDDYQVEFIERC